MSEARIVAPPMICVFDALVIGKDKVYTSVEHHALLGAWHRYAIQVVADETTGTDPELTVALQCSSDGQRWLYKNDTPEISSANLIVGDVTTVSGYDEGTRPGFGRGRLEIGLFGTDPATHLKIWVVPRTML